MIRFGPAGASESFAREGFRHTHQAPAWLRAMGLDALEYPAGRGVGIGEESARKIGEQARENGIAMSIHAPYYINLASLEPEKVQKTLEYIEQSARAVSWMGGQRVVVHPGSAMKGDREEAMCRACDVMAQAVDMAARYGAVLCPETMGKLGTLGTVEEIIRLCRVHESVLPTIDFAHIHARGQGAIVDKDDYRRVLDAFLAGLGMERMRHFHMHFSHIEYGPSGEKRHRNFDEPGYGPDFAPLAELFCEYGLAPTVICESAGHQAEDALAMKRIYEQAAGDQG